MNILKCQSPLPTLLLFSIFSFFYPYFTWGNTIIYTATSIILLLLALLITIKNNRTHNIVGWLVFFAFYVYINITNVIIYNNLLINYYYIGSLILILIDPKILVKSCILFSRILAFIILLSFISYLLVSFKIIDFSKEIITSFDDREYYTYFLNSVQVTEFENPFYLATGFTRFYSFFNEPGYLGTISSIVLCGLKFNFKKYKFLYIYLICNLFTFSYAFYFVSAIFPLLYYNKRLLKYGVQLTILFIILYFSLGNLIIDKFEDRSDTGKGKPENVLDTRSSELFNKKYNSFINYGDEINLIFGNGNSAHTKIYGGRKALGGTASWKTLIYNYGYFGFLFYIVVILAIFYSVRNKSRFAYAFLFIYLFTIYHRPNVLQVNYVFLFLGFLYYDKYQSIKTQIT